VGYNSVANNTGFILLPIITSEIEKCREIPIEFDLTAVQGHPRSLILVSMESTYM